MSGSTKNNKTAVNVWQLSPGLRYTRVVGICLIACLCGPALAQLGGGPSGLKGNTKAVGVTMYQASGLTGVIYLKAVPQINPQGEYTGDKLELYNSVNTKMKWMVRFDLPQGRDFVGLSVSANTTGASVSPATADSWNGQTMIDKVSIAPWSINRVLQQCEQHLRNPDGTYKTSAVFNLQPNLTERVKVDGHCRLPGAPPSNTESYSAQAYPRTRVTAYVLDARSGRQPGLSGFSQTEQRPAVPAENVNLPRRPGGHVRQPALPGRVTRDNAAKKTSVRFGARKPVTGQRQRSTSDR